MDPAKLRSVTMDSQSSDEKPQIIQEEFTPVGRTELHSKLPPHDNYDGVHRWDPEFEWSPEEEAAVIRKADWKLLTIICLMFLGLQLDRGNLSNATADNILKNLHLTTNDYNNGTTIQVLAFLLCEFPSQLIVARVGFKRWLPFLMFCWGIVSCFQAFMTGKTGFFITRALIGVFESGFIPGAVTLCSYWYKSKEMAIRLSFFWTTLNLARVVSSLLAAGILTMRGVKGRPGWFWLFIIEGAFTCVVAVVSFFWLPWSPVRTQGGIWRKPWYTEREEKIMVNRVLRDDPAKGLSPMQMKIQWADVRAAWSDAHLWLLVFVGLVAYIPQNPVQAYFTLSLKTLGYSTLRANMLSVTPAFLQIILMLSISYSSGYFNERSFHCLFGELWSLPCLIAMRALPDGGYVWARFALTTLVSGYPYFHPIITAWISENSFSVKRRYVQITTYNVVVQMGAVIASQLYRKDDAPYYHRGNLVLICICVVASIAIVVTWWYIGYENNKKEKIWSSMTATEKNEYQEDLAARETEGPKRLDFRITR